MRPPLLLLALAALPLAAQTADDDSGQVPIAPQPARVEALRMQDDAAFERWQVQWGGSLAQHGISSAEEAPWAEFRTADSRFDYRPPGTNFQLSAAANDQGSWRLGLRALNSSGGRFELNYRRTQRNFFDNAPQLFSGGAMSAAAAGAYTRLMPSALDLDGEWDPSGIAGAPWASRSGARIRRDLLSASYTQRFAFGGDFTVALDLQRRHGTRVWSFVQPTGMQVFPAADGAAYGENKAVTAFLLPVDDRETGVSLAYHQGGGGWRFATALGWTRHIDGNRELNASNPWTGLPSLRSRIGENNDLLHGEISLAKRWGNQEFSARARLEEGRADIALENVSAYSGAPLAGTVHARVRRERLALEYRGDWGNWTTILAFTRKRRWRTDAPMDFPEYDHPLYGAQFGVSGALPGLARSPRPMNRQDEEGRFTLERALTLGGVTGSLRASAARGREKFSWRAVEQIDRSEGSLEIALGGMHGRMQVAGKFLARSAPPPVANYYETTFIGPDGALFLEPGQAPGFAAADLLGGHRLELRASGERDLSTRWSFGGDGQWQRDRFSDRRTGLSARESSAASLTLTGLLGSRWQWVASLSGQALAQDQDASKQSGGGGETVDPLDPSHQAPVFLATRISGWELAQTLRWQPARWQLELSGYEGGSREAPGTGAALDLTTRGAALRARFHPRPRGFYAGLGFDWRRVHRDNPGGDLFPTLIDAPRNDPYAALPAPDLFQPAPVLGPQGWSIGISLGWRE